MPDRVTRDQDTGAGPTDGTGHVAGPAAADTAANGPRDADAADGRVAPSGQRYWRSLEAVAGTSEFREFVHREFPAGASELLDGEDRRGFLKIMGASFALAGLSLAGCRRWPEQEIAPYAQRPAGRVPGVPVYYATCRDLAGVATPLLLTCYDGRPIKVEGNPDAELQRGASTVYDQGSILDLYDPDRSRRIVRKVDGAWQPADRATFVRELESEREALLAAEGEGLAILTEETSSPTVRRLMARIAERMPKARFYTHESVAADADVAGATMAFGSPHRSRLDLEQAKAIVTLDADLLGEHPAAVPNIRGWARSRAVGGHASANGNGHDHGADGSISRMHCFEPGLTITGAMADDRTALRPDQIAVVAAAIANEVLGNDVGGPFADAYAALPAGVREAIGRAAADLKEHRGHSLLVAGHRQPAEVHALCHLVNDRLGNAGTTIRHQPMDARESSTEAIARFAADCEADSIRTLLVIGGNPAYAAPADLDIPGHIASIERSIHLGEYRDETAECCTWHVNRAHAYECWGDGRAWDGTHLVAQPTIRPLFDGLSSIELLAMLAGEPTTEGRALVEATAREAGHADWRGILHDGFVRGSAARTVTARTRADAAEVVRSLQRRVPRDAEGWTAVFALDPAIHDGRFANNGWLQELPDPMTKITWDNAAIMSVASAEDLGVGSGDVVRIAAADGAGDRAIELPVFVLPGLAERTVVLHLGYGRRMPGRICADAGVDVSPLRTTSNPYAAPVTIERTGRTAVLATTQDHHTIAVETVGGRGVQDRLPTLVREADVREYNDHPDFAAHRTHVPHRLSLWEEDKPFHEDGDGIDAPYAWGMSIDLNACVGCNACVIACQAENNIPVVGKDQVKRGREMQWLRIDRYFKFGRDGQGNWSADHFQGVSVQPMACVHCENAPCEQVCPVAATVHDEDGLNVMVYNRCIGTRYCSNNCPYKVRRFNYFDYHRRRPLREQPGTLLQVEPEYYTRPQAAPEPLHRMQMNPEVTIRVRGVMEKCTYCLQRIASAKIEAKNEWVKLADDDPRRQQGRIPVADGAVMTACQQACPAEAIHFGDLLDTDSVVAKDHRDPRAYELLEELNTKPRTKYLARLLNPSVPLSTDHGGHGGHGGHGSGDGGHDAHGGDGHGAGEGHHG